MTIRTASLDDAAAVAAIYAPVVRDTAISFEIDPPDAAEMRRRIVSTLATYPWLVATDAGGAVEGYAYATRFRERPAYAWAVETSAYVHERARGRGVGRALYDRLFALLADLGHVQAFAGIALPNAASVALHESVGFALIGVYRDVGFKGGAWHDLGRWQRRLQAVPPADPAPPRPFAG